MELLTRSSYLLSQSRDKWTDSQKKRAGILFQQYPGLLDAYELVNRLRGIFRNKHLKKDSGKTELQEWCDDVASSGFDGLKTAAETIESRLEEVANYFEHRNTNAPAESLNSKLKGFRSMLRCVSDLQFFMYRESRFSVNPPRTFADEPFLCHYFVFTSFFLCFLGTGFTVFMLRFAIE